LSHPDELHQPPPSAALAWMARRGQGPTESGTIYRVPSACFDPTDSTECLEAALAVPADMVYLPAQVSPWVTSRPLFVTHSNQEIVLAAGAVIEAKAGCFRDYESCLLTIGGVSNVTIRGERPRQWPQAGLRMRKQDYTNTSHYPLGPKPFNGPQGHRHVLSIGSQPFNGTKTTHAVRVLDLTLSLAGGDGIEVNGATDIELTRVDASDNFRQGMSVIDVDGLTVTDSDFRGTKGVAPQAGVDLEPDIPTQRLANIKFHRCRFTDNAGAGFQVVPGNLDRTSAPLSILFSNSNSTSNDMYGVAFLFLSPGKNGPYFAGGSHILVENVAVDGSKQEGVALLNIAAPPGETLLTLRNVSVSRVASVFPVFFLARGMGNGTMGGLAVENLAVFDTQVRPWLNAQSNSNATRWGKIGGTVAVHNPQGCSCCYSAIDAPVGTCEPCTSHGQKWFAVTCEKHQML
jgi:hypothetical protein